MGGNAVCFQAVTEAEEAEFVGFAKRKISLKRVCVFFEQLEHQRLCSAAVLLEVLHTVHDPKLC